MNPRLEVDPNGIGRVTFDDPARQQNILARDVLGALGHAMDTAEAAVATGTLRALVFRSAKAHSFIAGADLGAIAAIRTAAEGEHAAREGQHLFGRIAALAVPTVAAVRGVCLGGGTELALACGHRLAANDDRTRIGLPEVQLGILPGWGGTTRLPRLIGLTAALEIILGGKSVSAARAHRIGLVDRLLPAPRFDALVLEFARRLGDGVPRKSRPPRRSLARRFLDGTVPGRALALRAARQRVIRRAGRHYPAPHRILEVMQRGIGGPAARSFKLEARAVGELVVSPVCGNLLFLFGLREGARRRARTANIGWGAGAGAGFEPVRRMAVIGAGTMGGGIAQVAAWNGVRVRLADIRTEAVASGLAHASRLFDKAVRRRTLSRREAGRRMALISGTTDLSGVGTADVVVEAVVERLDVKRKVLADLEARAGKGAILATNTSSLSIDELAKGLKRPERLAGMHFFNPVHRMPLVEIVRGHKTSPETVERLAALAIKMGKTPVVTRDAPGFLVNRILGPCLNEAGHLLDESWEVAAVDRAWRDFGMPMGPFRLIDEIGIDVVRHAGEALAKGLGARLTPAPALLALAESGRLGRKNGRGFYRYRDGRKPRFDRSVDADIGWSGPGPRGDPAIVRERLVLAMINEAARVLQEGVVDSAADVDLGMVMGAGFPPFRGGLLRYADTRGAASLVRDLETLRDRWGARFEPAALLVRLAESGERFHADGGAAA